MLNSEMVNAIGSAYLEEDGTLVLFLHKNIDTRLNFASTLRIKPENPRYQKYLDHIGGIECGERKPIPPWPA